jgi:hypothetical protein
MEEAAQKKKPKPKARKVRRGKLMTLWNVESEYAVPYATSRDLVLNGFLPRVQLGDSKRIWVRRADVERMFEARQDGA